MADAQTVQPRGTDVNLRSPLQNLEYDAVADHVASLRPQRVLDWGCGWGQVTRRLIDRGLDVTSYDFREGMEPTVQPMDRFPELEIHVSGEPVKLPFEDDAFDLVLSLGVLEHVPDPDGSLEELKRILVPGGRVVVKKLPNRFSYLEAIAKRLGWYYHGKLPFDQVYTQRSAIDLARRHGFVVETVRRANMLPLTLTNAMFQRLARPLWWLNGALARVPVLNLVATDHELVLRAPDIRS